MNIDEMPAGREMDALVAEKVMGYKVVRASTVESLEWTEARGEKASGMRPPKCIMYNIAADDLVTEHDGMPPRHYSTDIAAAWEVVNRMCDLRRYFNLSRNDDLAGVAFYDATRGHFEESGDVDDIPHMICRAALKAVGL